MRNLRVFFVDSKLDNTFLYDKVKKELPKDVREFFDYNLLSGRKLSSLIFSVSLNSAPINYSTNRVVPYFDRETYYILQEILRKIDLPKINNVALNELYLILNQEFDIMLFSNIFSHINMNVKDYKSFLKNYLKYLRNSGVIQANYAWTRNETTLKEFENNGFTRDEIPSIRFVNGEDEFKDYVFTLKNSA